jgi:hypothetical protein
MKPQWDAQIAQFSSVIDKWRSVVPRLPATFNTSQGISVPTNDLAKTLEELYAAIKDINGNNEVDPILLGVHQAGVLNPIGQLAALVNNLQANPASQILDQIAQQTWSIRASLVWLVPGSASAAKIASKVSELDLDSKVAALRNLSLEYAQEISKSKDINKAIKEQQQEVLVILDSLKSHEREAANAKTNAEANATIVATNKDTVTSQLAELTSGIERQTTLLSDIESLKLKATSTLESTSKVALAASFTKRKEQLEVEQLFWKYAFGAGISSIFIVGILTIKGVLSLPPVFKDNEVYIGPLLARLVLFGPLVWVTWFSARQYGSATRLIEDYAFKEASALAFVGYQREMSDDSEMIKLLRESAISNFGNQPTRIFEKTDPASPLHELLDKALEKGAVDKFMDLVKTLVPGKK